MKGPPKILTKREFSKSLLNPPDPLKRWNKIHFPYIDTYCWAEFPYIKTVNLK